MGRIIVVCGPTASGKTALAIALAQKLNGEIVSADSMQIYRGMDIGTAKPTADEQRQVVHHMIDVAEPQEVYSAARYAEEASKVVDCLLAQGKTPIVCGGTGLYINALISGGDFASFGDGEIRERLKEVLAEKGEEHIHFLLAQVDPESAQKLHVNDTKRVIRALEVYYATGKTISEHNRLSKLKPPRYEAIIIGICPREREVLYERINRRVDDMLSMGLETEVRHLYSCGKLEGTAAQAIGYKEMLGYISGKSSLCECAELIKQKSRNYAKRQLSWFRADKRVNWIYYDKDCEIADLCQKATSFI